MTTKTFDIVVLPGDGIGIEVTAAALRVLTALGSRMPGVKFNCTEHSVGAAEFLRSGSALPETAFQACKSADAVLLGAMGLPSVRQADGLELTPQIEIRERLDLFNGVRPTRLFHANDTPLKRLRAGELDFVILREQTEGLFSSRHARHPADATAVTDIMLITHARAARICHEGFKLARKRRKLVTLVDKANVLPSMVFFRTVFDEVALQYPDVKTERVYVDACALYLLQRPHTFDVLVTENMFGDILSDLAAGLVGGLGMAPSADIGPTCAVFQPAHGTAPDIAGKGIANPIAAILSLALMLDWLAHPETVAAARSIERAVQRVFDDPAQRTRDMGGTLSTDAMTSLVIEQAMGPE